MIAHSADVGVGERRDRQGVEPEGRPHRGRDPEVRRVEELPDRADRDRGKEEGCEEHELEERRSTLHVGDEDGEEESEPGQEHDGDAGEQERVQQAPMEDRVAEDRTRVVVEPHEVREVEALGVMQAEHDAVDERVEEEAGEDRQDRQEEEEVDGAFAARAAERSAREPITDSRAESRPRPRRILVPPSRPTVSTWSRPYRRGALVEPIHPTATARGTASQSPGCTQARCRHRRRRRGRTAARRVCRVERNRSSSVTPSRRQPRASAGPPQGPCPAPSRS